MTLAASPKNSPRSPLEKCSFVCHLFTFPIGLVYFLWVLVPNETLEEMHITYYPPKAWSVHMPVSALILFLATPILYAAMNSFAVPRLDSNDTISDGYTRQPQITQKVHSKIMPIESTLPEICDLDPATLSWYPRRSENE